MQSMHARLNCFPVNVPHRPFMASKTEQISVRMPPELYRTLMQIEKKHGLSATEIARRALEEIAGFYNKHGWLNFPLRIEPLAGRLVMIRPKIGEINVWDLHADKDYKLEGDELVSDLARQLGVPNLFPQASEHDKAHFVVAFEDHPTHWIIIHLWKGHVDPSGNGLLFEAHPKSSVPREEMEQILKKTAAEMEIERIGFSQLPMFEAARKAQALASAQTK